ncbi:hypothetical protein PHYC_03014 [Phycisphaerales bacterium]|nr:hypothetical protein PHYC_03014 [Phycisphaerales bacterium]
MFRWWVAVLCAMASVSAEAQTGFDFTFTYQGRLDSSGAPVSGAHDFRFRLYDAATGGSQVGTVLCADDVTVTGGLFVVALEFINAYDGNKRFLEIDVRPGAVGACSDSTGYTTLLPRQELTATPYAVLSRFSGLAYTADRLGDYPWTFYLDASNLATGTLADGRLGANVARTNAPQTFAAAQTFSNGSFLLRNAANTFSTQIDASAATASRSILFPDASGTVITTGNLSAITATGTIGSGVWNGTAISVSRGGTGADLSATGGAGRVLKQISPGGAITVGPLQTSDLPNLAGDVNGPGGSNTVSSLQGQTLSMGAPAVFDALVWNGASWSPGSPMMGGDVLGAANNAVVQRIQGRSVLGFAPNNGDALVWLAGSWGPGQLSIAGDVVGASGSTTVTRLYGRSLSSTAPSPDQVLWYNGDVAQWQPRTFSTADMPHTHAPTDLAGPVPVSLGGTGATSAPAALINLNAAGQAQNNVFSGLNAFSAATSFFDMTTVTVSSTTVVPLTTTSPSGTTADLQRWNVGGGPVARVTSSGGLMANSVTTAGAVTAGSLVLSPGVTRYKEISCHEFRPVNSTIAYNSGGTNSHLEASGAGTAAFTAGLDLPDGAAVTEIRFKIYDNDAARDMFCAIYSYADGFTDNAVTGGSSFSTGAAGTVRDVLLLPTYSANTSLRTQYLRVQWDAAAGTNIRVFKVRVAYTITSPLP